MHATAVVSRISICFEASCVSPGEPRETQRGREGQQAHSRHRHEGRRSGLHVYRVPAGPHDKVEPGGDWCQIAALISQGTSIHCQERQDIYLHSTKRSQLFCELCLHCKCEQCSCDMANVYNSIPLSDIVPSMCKGACLDCIHQGGGAATGHAQKKCQPAQV